MRETNFIQQNKQKWQDFEAALDGQQADPDKLSEQFVQITDDLSYARTFYPNRSVRVYLNGLAQRIFFSIYKSRSSPIKRLSQFWLEDLPLLMYEARREFLLSFLIFVVAFGIGVLSSVMDPQFAETILGPDYVAETLKNIERGDPMAIYKQPGQFGMSLGITANNTWVAFITFMTGILFGIGSVAIMIQNAIMVGTFQYFFIEKGLFWESFLTIWVHGTLEISAIIIACTAGITMGKGLVFPGTFTRAQSFQRSARRGVKIMIGIVPIIIMAGILEGYMTRHTETPDFIRGVFIFICLLFVITYFVWYPQIKVRYMSSKPLPDAKIPPDRVQPIDFKNIKSSGEVFGEVFNFYRTHLVFITLLSLALAFLFTGAAFLFSNGKPASKFFFADGRFGIFNGLHQFFNIEEVGFLTTLHLFTFTVLITSIFNRLRRLSNPELETDRATLVTNYLKALVPVLILVFFCCIQRWFSMWLLLAALPFLLTWIYIMQTEEEYLFTGFSNTYILFSGNIGRAAGLLFVLFLIGMLLFLITDEGILWFYLKLVTWIIPLSEAQMAQFNTTLFTFISFFALNLIFSLFIIGFGLLYYTFKEIQEAGYLRERIQEIGLAKQIKGLEQEG